MGHAALGKGLQVIAAFQHRDHPAGRMAARQRMQFAGDPGEIVGFQHQVGLRIAQHLTRWPDLDQLALPHDGDKTLEALHMRTCDLVRRTVMLLCALQKAGR